MAIPNTVEDDVLRGLTLRVSHRILNNELRIKYKDNGDSIIMPIESIANNYSDILENYVDAEIWTEEEQRRYWYRPKLVSIDLYGVDAYWSLILYLNECHSVIDFTPEIIRFIIPDAIDKIINEILILEKALK